MTKMAAFVGVRWGDDAFFVKKIFDAAASAAAACLFVSILFHGFASHSLFAS